MKIGELSGQSGFTKDTIRWYEKIGLIRRVPKSSESHYRTYGKEDLQKLHAIRQIKSMGFTISETQELFDLEAFDELHCEQVSPILESRLRQVEDEIRRLRHIREKLLKAKSDCTGRCGEVLYPD